MAASVSAKIRAYGVNKFGRDCPGVSVRTVKSFLKGCAVSLQTMAAIRAFANTLK